MFSSSLENFKIQLNNPTATYAPGETIEGQVIVDLNKKKSLRALKLRFKGKCEVKWKERRKKKNVAFTGNEEYFRTDLCLFGDPDGDTVEMPVGKHIFPFSFNLPQNIPNTFDHYIGSVRYSIKAIIDRPWKFDYEITLIFAVESPWDLNSEMYSLTGINDEIETDYFCLLPCFNRGHMKINFEMPTTGYACGELIEVTVFISNKSSVEVTELELFLEQRLEFHAYSPYDKSYVEKNVIQSIVENGIFANKKSAVISLQVPSVPYSNFEHCGIIDISYCIWICVSVSGCHCPTRQRYNILIGSRPSVLMSIQDSSFDSSSNVPNAPTAPDILPNNSSPLLPSDQHIRAPYPMPITTPYPMLIPTDDFTDFSNNTQPTRSIGFVLPDLPPLNADSEEMPPPSYDSIMADNIKK